MKQWMRTTSIIAWLILGATAVQAHEDGGCNSLPPEKQQMVEKAMHAAHEKNRGLMEQEHKLHEDLKAIVKAKNFDKDAFIAKQHEIAELHNRLHDDSVVALASVMGKLTPEEREKLLHSLHHGHHWHHHDKQADKDNNTADSDDKGGK